MCGLSALDHETVRIIDPIPVCMVPRPTQHVGDYLTVADTVPTPAPGQGVYYVTAATYQGATRYGRKTTAGHLSGRDPAVLPGCGQP